MSCRTMLIPWLAVAVAAQDRVEYATDPYPGSYRDGWLATRLVDDLSGAPIAGAEVFLVPERETPLAGEFWFERKAASDAQGFVRIPTGDLEGKWHIQVVRHPQHGVSTRSDIGAPVWRIGRSFDVPVLVRDWLGRPAPGARIGLCGGCGHTPDLVDATSAANGIALLRGVDPHNHIADVYVQHPGLGLGYDSVRWFPGDAPFVLDCDFSPLMHGTVVDHRRRPAAGVFVGALEVHRGPWAKTAADGTFTILGGRLDTGASQVVLSGRKVYFETPGRYPVTLTLPDPEGEDPVEGSIDVEGFSREPVATRTVRVRLEDGPPSGLVASVDYPGAPEHLQTGEDAVEVPLRGPFTIAVWPRQGGSYQPRRRITAFADIAALPAEPIELRWFAATSVVARVVDEHGRSAAVRVRVRTEWSATEECPPLELAADGRLELRTGNSGLSLLEIVPERGDLRPRLVWTNLPLRSDDARIDLGTLTLSTVPQLRVLGAGDGIVSFARPGLQEAGNSRAFPLAADGAWLGPDLRAGDAIVVQLDTTALPFRTVLAGDGPWTIRPPRGELTLTVVDASQKLLAATIVLGDLDVETAGESVLRGLPHGPLRLFVSAPGHQTAIVDTVVGPTAGSLRLVLPALE